MTKLYEKYLQRHPIIEGFETYKINESKIIVVIPVYMEEDLASVLVSLSECDKIDGIVSVLLVINSPEDASEEVLNAQNKTIKRITCFDYQYEAIQFHTVKAFDLPKKYFGVGLARKIGMDIAANHFYNNNNPEGIIVSLDADSTVDRNYFTELIKFFNEKKYNACSINFSHPTSGFEYSRDVYHAITLYELHLRYYVQALKYVDYPYATHTIGSCFAFNAKAYIHSGGMNKRKGGEEFYFIQKLQQSTNYGHLNTTSVHPSPRASSRVPFGTGPEVRKILEHKANDYFTYDLNAFICLKQFFNRIDEFYNNPDYLRLLNSFDKPLADFLFDSEFDKQIAKMSLDCSTIDIFRRRFFEVFNSFKIVKYLNFVHKSYFTKQSVVDESIKLLKLIDKYIFGAYDESDLLELYRQLDDK